MSWLDKLSPKSAPKNLILFDADAEGLAKYKGKYERLGYEVVAVLVASDGLRSKCTEGDLGKTTSELLSDAFRKGLRSEGLLAADYIVSQPEQLVPLFAHVQPDAVLTDNIQSKSKGGMRHADLAINSAEPIIRAAAASKPGIAIVLHTRSNDRHGHLPAKTEKFSLGAVRNGSATTPVVQYWQTGKHGNLAHDCLQGKARGEGIGA